MTAAAAAELTVQRDWGRDDWAIAVGIDRYPGLADLTGAENDATAFCHWLREVGQVPAAHIVRLVSSDFADSLAAIQPRHRPSLHGAMPSHQRIEDELVTVYNRAIEHLDAGHGRRIGRRLYLFFAGHGFEPLGFEPRDPPPAFLAANADRHHPLHVPPLQAADWFSLAWAFDEVILLMDCCREQVPRLALSRLSWPEKVDDKRISKNPFLYGFGVQSSQTAREFDHHGAARGLFTRAVLDGLGGAAADGRGIVTAHGLKRYLVHLQVQGLLPAAMQSTSYDWRPDIRINDYADFVLVPGDLVPPTTGYRLKLCIDPAYRDHTLRIERQNDVVIREAQIRELEWTGALDKGVYKALVLAPSGDRVTEKPFHIDGPGDTTVHL